MPMTFDEKTRSTSNFFNNKGRCTDDCLIIIFGGSGDLAKRKLFPALANLMSKKLLPEHFKIIAVGRKPMENKDLLSMGKYPPGFTERFTYLQTDYSPEGIRKLKETCARICTESNIAPNYLFYLAIPPEGYSEVAKALKAGGLVYPPKGANWSRLVVEKPYGKDIESATVLNENLLSCFAEKQIYRIDHYLGKEAVQNLLVFRFANSVFEAMWNHHYIEHVQISHSENPGRGRPCGLFRPERVVAGHDPEPSHADFLPRDHGTSGQPFRGRHPRREGQGPAQLAALGPGNQAPRGHPRPIRSRHHQGQVRRRLSPGKRRQAGKQHGNLRGAAHEHRQLPLGRRAFLPPLRKAPGPQGYGSGGHLQEAAAHPVQQQERFPEQQPHRLRDPAPGSHPAGTDHQESRPELRTFGTPP